ncbi:MAG: ABC transporter substrate-binding protein [Lentisphaeria bacterium]|nr:ABC transporter substrate-binding protein [Lentisphaeria bacterium]
MKRLALALVVPVLLVILPLVLRPSADWSPAAPERLVVITPNSEQIKYEFEHAFRKWYREHRGRDIMIDWRSPGGTSDIVRYINDRFEAEFRLYALEKGLEWDRDTAAAFKNPNLKPDDHPARKLLLESDIGIGIDLFFGGGTYDQAKFASIGYAVDAGVKDRHPDWFTDEVIPMNFAGEQIYDPQGRYYGYCLSSFGIAYNFQRVRELGVEPPQNWIDLTDPAYSGTLVLADPTKSGSITKCYEMIIQQAMAELGPEQGWLEGFRRVKLLTANARSIADSAGKVVRDVSSGEAAAGVCIDFYGFSEAEWSRQTTGAPTMTYVMPRGGTAVTADPVQILRGAPNPGAAKDFIDFLLSKEGAAIWLLKPGAPGGPERYVQLRPTVRKDSPREFPADQLALPDYRPYDLGGTFEYRSDWTGRYFSLIRVLIKCAALDPEDDLRTAWKAILDNGGPEANPESMAELLTLPVPYESAADESKALNGTPAEAAAARRRWTEAARTSYLRAAELARKKGAASK